MLSSYPEHSKSATRRRQSFTSWSALSLAALLLASALASAPAWPAEAQAELPPLPTGWPSTLELGQSSSKGNAPAMKATAPFGFRYQYLSGGWSTWNSNGTFVTSYVNESVANGITPVFTYYMIVSHAGGESNVLSGLQTSRR